MEKNKVGEKSMWKRTIHVDTICALFNTDILALGSWLLAIQHPIDIELCRRVFMCACVYVFDHWIVLLHCIWHFLSIPFV